MICHLPSALWSTGCFNQWLLIGPTSEALLVSLSAHIPTAAQTMYGLAFGAPNVRTNQIRSQIGLHTPCPHSMHPAALLDSSWLCEGSLTLQRT